MVTETGQCKMRRFSNLRIFTSFTANSPGFNGQSQLSHFLGTVFLFAVYTPVDSGFGIGKLEDMIKFLLGPGNTPAVPAEHLIYHPYLLRFFRRGL